MTYRERRERKAERLRGWSDKRAAKATALRESSEPYRHDHAFLTQPGRIPERDRMFQRDAKAYEHTQKAQSMDERAAGIDRQLDRSIYDDDPDAIERLEERIAALEDEREQIKAVNRKRRSEGKESAPAYMLQNLGGRITKDRQRLERIKAQQQRHTEAEANGGTLVQVSGDYCTVTFDEKPARETRDALKGAGFRFSKGSWVGKAANLPADIR